MDAELNAAEAQKRTDAASYDSTAEGFDALTERFSAKLAERTLDLARLAPGDRLLDVGTGTGLVALRAARRLGSGHAMGVDHSSGMLGQASAKAERQGLSERAAFRSMDAEALDFPDGAFDVVTSLFVLRHLPNPEAAIREMRRVLAPGGRLVAGVGAGAPLISAQGFAAAARAVASRIAQAQGRLLLAPHFLRSLMAERGLWVERQSAAHHGAIDVPGLLRAAGFAQVSASWSGETVELDPEGFWSVQAIYGSAERTRLAELAPDIVAALKSEFLDRAGRVHAKGGRLVYRYGAMFYQAGR